MASPAIPPVTSIHDSNSEANAHSSNETKPLGAASVSREAPAMNMAAMTAANGMSNPRRTVEGFMWRTIRDA